MTNEPDMPTLPFGKTGHRSSRVLFGAAALGAMRQEKADALLDVLLDSGINHIDTAASYGDAELRLAPWMKAYRKQFFLATKTGDRSYDGAKASIERSLRRMEVDHVDLIQFHNLTDAGGWETLFGNAGALKAAVEARDAGQVRFIGVTGHGTRVAHMHLRSLAEFEFDSVLLPYNPLMMQNLDYAADFNALHTLCSERGVAMQTIKSVARRRWRGDDDGARYSWYEPIRQADVLTRLVHWVLSRDGVFLNSSSDATLLPLVIAAARSFAGQSEAANRQVLLDMKTLEAEPLFVPGQDGV